MQPPVEIKSFIRLVIYVIVHITLTLLSFLQYIAVILAFVLLASLLVVGLTNDPVLDKIWSSDGVSYTGDGGFISFIVFFIPLALSIYIFFISYRRALLIGGGVAALTLATVFFGSYAENIDRLFLAGIVALCTLFYVLAISILGVRDALRHFLRRLLLNQS